MSAKPDSGITTGFVKRITPLRLVAALCIIGGLISLTSTLDMDISAPGINQVNHHLQQQQIIRVIISVAVVLTGVILAVAPPRKQTSN